MSHLRQKIAQMLIMGFKGTELGQDHSLRRWLAAEGLGGVLLFNYDMPRACYGKNMVDSAQVKRLNQQIMQANQADWPLLIAIDYEGGAVDRTASLDDCMKTMPAAQQANLSVEAFAEEIGLMASTIKSLGFNLNFAPVVDLNLNQQEGIIGKLGRSFSSDPRRVSSLAYRFVEGFASQGIIGCYKHFPGHGSALGDTHEGFVDVTETFVNDELLPYRDLANHPALPMMIMTAHVINRQLDPSGLPATLSKPILTDLLRHELKYEGVIISDDLQMRAIADHYSLAESLQMTVNAGADMVIFGNQLGWHEPDEIIATLESLVLAGKVSHDRIDEAFARIIRLKQSL